MSIKLFNLYVCFFLIISCSNNKNKFDTCNDILFNGKQFEVGDILVKKKGNNFLSWWGHSSIIVGENMVGDFPKLGKKYYEVNLEKWVLDKREITVLRYIKINKVFREKLLKNIEKYKNKPYRIFLLKENENGFYCSKFIWFIYKKTAEELGEKLDIGNSGNFIIFPYDFIDSQELKKVKIYKIKRGEKNYEKNV